MPTTNKNTATNKNTINVKVVVGDTVKKKKPRRRRAPSSRGDSGPPPPPSVINNIMPSQQPSTQATSYNDPPSSPPPPPPPRSGASMFNRPYDVADAAVGTVGEDVPEGLASNYAAYEETRARYFMSLQEQMEELARSEAGTDFTDLTIAPSDADGSIQHGGQSQSRWYSNDSYAMPTSSPDRVEEPDASPGPEALPHRSATFALPPTQATLALPAPPTQTQSVDTEQTEEPTPSALPGPSRGRTRVRTQSQQDATRDAMRADGWIEGSERATATRRREYEKWVSDGRPKNIKPSWWR